MAIFKTYKQREIEKNKTEQDVYFYDEIPEALRYQAYYSIVTVLGNYNKNIKERAIYEDIHKFFLAEEGVGSLKELVGEVEHVWEDPETEIKSLLLNTKDIYLFLSVIEYFIFATYKFSSDKPFSFTYVNLIEAIETLNERFQRASFGYELINGKIVRIDSKELHKEIVKPSLTLLWL